MVSQYYIFEIKQYQNGDYEHQVHYVWDEDPNLAELKAESKYHEILSAAAVSNFITHSCIVINTESVPVMHQAYHHPLPEPEPEPEVEPETSEEPETSDEPVIPEEVIDNTFH